MRFLQSRAGGGLLQIGRASKFVNRPDDLLDPLPRDSARPQY